MTGTVREKLIRAEQGLVRGEYGNALKLVETLAAEAGLPADERLACLLLKNRLLVKLGELEKALALTEELLQATDEREHPLFVVDLLTVKAEVSWRAGRLEDGLGALDEGEVLLAGVGPGHVGAEEGGIDRRKGALLHHRGIICWYKGDLDRALEVHQQSRAIKEGLGDRQGLAGSFNNLGLVYWSKGDVDQALEHYRQSLAISEELGQEPSIASLLANMGNIYARTGDLDQALACQQRSLAIKEELGQKQGIFLSLINLGAVYQLKGELDRAKEHYQRSLAISEELGIRRDIALAINNLGNIDQLRGDLDQALQHFQRSLRIYTELGIREETALLQFNIGGIHSQKGNLNQALANYERSLAVYDELGNDPLTAIVLCELVWVALEREDPSQAERYLQRLQQIDGRTDSRSINQRCRVARAFFLKSSKRARDKLKAEELLEQVVEEEVADHALTVTAMIHLCELWLFELKMTGEDELLGQIKNLTHRLLGIARQQSSHSLLAETYLLQSKLALIELDLGQAKALLEQALAIAEERGLRLLARTVAQERDLLQSQVLAWQLIIERKPSMGELIDLTQLDHLLKQMAQRTVAVPAQEGAPDGQRIDEPLNQRYRLDAEIGRGSMGRVYRATDLHTGELVAVKALDPGVVTRDPGIVERFAREGEALRQLNHPNIVRMVAAVEEEGLHYLVMEYVPGGSLQDLLDAQGALPASRVLEIALDLADALTRAHRMGIIHRDLKPENVLLAEDGTPRLTDFGIARVSEAPRLTQTGILMGTPDFLSPEACSGQALDERTDIWAFGVLLFEMLTGETPFAGDSLTSKLMAILSQPVPDLARCCPGAPEALVDLVSRMLEKDRGQRIPSVRLVGAELEAILKGWEGPTTLHLAPGEGHLAGESRFSGASRFAGESRFSTPTPDTTRPRHSLPAQPTPFVGRESELTELARLLADPDVRLLTILGAGGMGKTRLALEAGAAQLGNFGRGVYFVSLAPLDSAQAIVPAVAGALGFSFYEGGEPRQQLLNYLREKNKLLIMDNFEHLLAGPEPGLGDGTGLVTDILQTAPDVKILTTSRARLNVQGEYLFRLAGMDYPEPLPQAEAETPEDALDHSAVKLFLQTARRARPGFELEAEDLRHVSHICRLVAGMPLGILLAAAWLTMLTPAEVAAEIEASLDFLETDQRDVPDRQRSLRAVFDHSWSLLTEHQRAVMQALSVFRGGFTRQAATQIAGASLPELRALVDRSLVERDPAGRYGIHEMLRQYAADRLGRAKEPAAEAPIRDAHATCYTAFLASREAPLRRSDQKQVLAEIRAEVDNIRAAWDWAVTQARLDEIEQSLVPLASFCRIQGWYREGETLFSRAAQRLSGTHKDRTRLLQGKLLLQQGRFAGFLGNRAEASRLQEASLAIFREFGAKRDAAHAICLLGGCEGLYGSQRRDLCLEGLGLFQELGDQQGIALALYGLSWSDLHRGEYTEARQSFEESLALFRQVGDLEGIQTSLHGLGYAYWILGEYERGRELHLEMLGLCRQAGDQGAIARALGDLGIDAAGLKSYQESGGYLQQSLALYREIGNSLGVADELGDLAELANMVGDPAQAIRLAQENLDILQRLGLGGLERQSWELRVLGDATFGLGDYERARRYLSMSLEASRRRQGGWPAHQLLTLVGIARLLAKQDDQERALELLALVLNHRHSWQMAKDRATALVAELVADLPSDIAAAAQERGRARDLDATVSELLDEWR